MPAEKYPLRKLKEILVDDWHPFPNSEELEGWEALPNQIREAYTRAVRRLCNLPGLPLLAVLFHLEA